MFIIILVIPIVLIALLTVKIIQWILKPFEECIPFEDNNTSSKEITAVLKPSKIPIENIVPYTGTMPDKLNMRPSTLKEFIGQLEAKESIKTGIKIIQELHPVHFILNGNPGCGKTSLLYILANMLNARLIYKIAGELADEEELVNILSDINTNDQLTILFIDEIHSLNPKIIECLYPILEDFKIQGKCIKPFVFACATTNKDVLVKKFSPLLDRIHFHITLTKYTTRDIINILKQYHNKLYKDMQILVRDYTIIADNCKHTPRIALSLLLKLIVVKDIKEVLKQSSIIYKGLTRTDIEILKYLTTITKPIGVDGIAQSIGISKADYLTIYEPYLVLQKYILRTSRGRIIGEKGKEILKILFK